MKFPLDARGRGRRSWQLAICGLIIASVLSSCALLPASEEDSSYDRDDIDSFARSIAEDLHQHRWQSLLVATDPVLYQSDVVLGGEEEVSFLVRLIGLDLAPNQIQVGDELEWTDLDRIVVASLAPTGSTQPPYHYTGQVTLDDGAVLRLNLWLTIVQGRFVLTPAPA